MRATLGILAAALIAAPVAAQNNRNNSNSGGSGRDGGEVSVKAGVSFGRVKNKGLLPGELDGRTGFTVGLGARTGGVLTIGIEGLYSRQGFENTAVGAGHRDVDYIEVPAYLRLNLPIEAISPFAFIGPQVSFEIRCKDDDLSCPDTNRNKTNYAGIAGAGIRLGSSRAISFEGRYVYGLKDLEFDTITSSGSYRTRMFMILGGISF